MRAAISERVDGERDEPAHRLLETSLLGHAPVRADDPRRVDAEVEADDRDEADQLDDERAGLDWSVANVVPRRAIVSVAAANASMRMRFAETDGWPRPASRSRTVTEIESSVQCTKNATTYTANPGDHFSPAAGMCGSANVNTVRPIVSAATIRRRRSPGGANVVANR